MAEERILVVDDEPGVRVALENILGDEGFRVISAESGEEGDLTSQVMGALHSAEDLANRDSGMINLQDAETGERRLVDTSSTALREALAEDAQRRDAALSRSLRSSGIDLVTIDASRPVVDPLLEFFRMRERRIRR